MLGLVGSGTFCIIGASEMAVSYLLAFEGSIDLFFNKKLINNNYSLWVTSLDQLRTLRRISDVYKWEGFILENSVC
jgi:hypothetical protein